MEIYLVICAIVGIAMFISFMREQPITHGGEIFQGIAFGLTYAIGLPFILFGCIVDYLWSLD